MENEGIKNDILKFCGGVDTKKQVSFIEQYARIGDSKLYGGKHGGSDAEHKGSAFIVQRLKEIGVPRVETVRTRAGRYQFNDAKLTVVSPETVDETMEIDSYGYRSPGTSPEGITAELDEALAGKAEGALPTMRWKKALLHPAFWILFVSIILIQMFGNVLVTDISEIAQSAYAVTAAEAAWVVTAFGIGCGVGGIVVGIISDRIGPYRTTFWLGIIDGVLLLVLAVIGANSFMTYAVICVIQGFTYNGMTALNPIMITDAYAAKDMGIMLGVVAVSYAIVGTIGPQLGLAVPFVPMLIVCAICSIAGGLFSALSKKSMNRYYKAIESECVVR